MNPFNMTAAQFRELVERARAGDQEAFAQLVRDFGKSLRRIYRHRIQELGLRNFLDSVDVYQSALLRFAEGLRAGDFRLDTPEDAVRLLITIGENRVVDHSRHLRAENEHRSLAPDQGVAEQADSHAADPRARLVVSEVSQWICERLGPEDWRLYRAGAAHNWTELAETYGATPDAIRKRHVRIMRRVWDHIESFVEQFPGTEEVLAKYGFPGKRRHKSR